MDVPLIVEYGKHVGVVDCAAPHELGDQRRFPDRSMSWNDDSNPAPADHAGVYKQLLWRTPRHRPLDIPAQPPVYILVHRRSEYRHTIAGDQELARLGHPRWDDSRHNVGDRDLRRFRLGRKLRREGVA